MLNIDIGTIQDLLLELVLSPDMRAFHAFEESCCRFIAASCLFKPVIRLLVMTGMAFSIADRVDFNFFIYDFHFFCFCYFFRDFSLLEIFADKAAAIAFHDPLAFFCARNQ